jgi:cytochrome c biogenesis protein ResB
MVCPAGRNRIGVSALGVERTVEVLGKTLSDAHVRVRRGVHQRRPALIGVSQGWSQWATVVFHVALLLVLLSVALVSLTEAEGAFRAPVGGGFEDRPGAYGRYETGPLGPTALGGWTLYLERFEPRYRRGDFVPGPASTIVVTTRDGVRHRRVNLTRGEYFEVEGANIFQNPSWGFAPVLAIRDPEGQNHTGAALVRRTPEGGGRPRARIDVSASLNALVQLVDPTRSTKTRPRVAVTLMHGNREVLNRTIDFGATVRAGGYSVTYEDFRYWSEFEAVRNPWLPLVNVAFWLSVAGLSVMYLWPTTYAWALVEEENGECVVYMGGRREKYSRDFVDLVEKTKKALATAQEENA